MIPEGSYVKGAKVKYTTRYQRVPVVEKEAFSYRWQAEVNLSSRRPRASGLAWEGSEMLGNQVQLQGAHPGNHKASSEGEQFKRGFEESI